VVGVAVLLVAGLARILGAGSDASDGGERAVQASAPQASESSTPSGTTTTEAETRTRSTSRKPRREPLPAPEGECVESDVVVTPTIKKAPGGSDVDIALDLRTQESTACTWQVSPESLTVKITSGSDLIWTSQDCRQDLPTEDVVVRRETGTTVDFTWDARRSDDGCPVHTEWALPGTYHVVAAALAGEPTDVTFELTRPTSAVVTKTVTPKPEPKKQKPERDRGDRQGQSPTEHQAGDVGVSEPDETD
jgi:hypothetical protein